MSLYWITFTSLTLMVLKFRKGKVNVTLTVKRTSRAFELSFQTDGMVWVPCDRCLDDMELPISSSDKLMVKFGHEYAEEGDNLIVIPEEEGEINVAWFMYEFVALSVPIARFCSEPVA